MAKNQSPNFPHRHNSDGSHDSICLRCFRTIASEADEARLMEAEDVHVCDVADLRYADVRPLTRSNLVEFPGQRSRLRG
jgi:hypothetical protein